MFIESAAEQVKKLTAFEHTDQLAELHTVGASRLVELGASGLNDDVSIGYLLGLQTARVILATNPALLRAGIKPGDLL